MAAAMSMKKYTERKSETRDDSDSDFPGILIIIGIAVSTDLAHGERILYGAGPGNAGGLRLIIFGVTSTCKSCPFDV